MTPAQAEIARAQALLEALTPKLGTLDAAVVTRVVAHLDYALQLLPQ